MSEQKTDKDDLELLELQAKMLQALLDGMGTYLYWDPINERIMLNSKAKFTVIDGVPVIEEDD